MTDILEILAPFGLVYGSGMLMCILFIEVPRYLVLVLAGVFYRLPSQRVQFCNTPFSLVIVGHNEGDSLSRSLLALKEQSRKPDEIIVVSDGSTDDMNNVLHRLQRRGIITHFHHLKLRGGKSAALNLALSRCRNEVVVCVDADTEFDRHALGNIVARLLDSGLGAVSGNVRLSNPRECILTELQDIEYQTRISAGKHGMDLMGQISLISGAFGAYRISALQDIGYFNPVSGEDLDVTLRLRQAGHKVGFARNAICYTRAPTTIKALVKQRYRWDRDGFNLRMRIHWGGFLPGARTFRWKEFLHYLDFLFFDLLPVTTTPFAFLLLWDYLGTGVWTLMLAYLVVYATCDLLIFFIGHLHESDSEPKQLFFVPLYIFYQFVFLRILRFLAYMSEGVFYASRYDDFVPEKVRKVVLKQHA